MSIEYKRKAEVVAVISLRFIGSMTAIIHTPGSSNSMWRWELVYDTYLETTAEKLTPGLLWPLVTHIDMPTLTS